MGGFGLSNLTPYHAQGACAFFDDGRTGVVSKGDFLRGLGRLRLAPSSELAEELFAEIGGNAQNLDFSRLIQFVRREHNCP